MLLDANILIRAVLGSKVFSLLMKYHQRINFFAPDIAFSAALEHLPTILEKRHVNAANALKILESLRQIVTIVQAETYQSFESLSRKRLLRRDQDDWPILAAALALQCPIWTEDSDFFGCGIATWTTDRVEIFLQQSASNLP